MPTSVRWLTPRFGEGVPLALRGDAAAPWRPELLGFLRRLGPERLFLVGEPAAPPPAGARITGIEPVNKPKEPLGWRGSLLIDEHTDGTRSLYWRVRILDGDAHRGKVRAQLKRAEFHLLGP